MTDSRYTALSISFDGKIARIRFTRPDLFNRFDEALHEEFPRALAEVEALDNPRALILEADGKAFSAGGDFDMIREGNQSEEMRKRLSEEAERIFNLMVSAPYPIIAAVQGAAVGLGATIVALSDIIVAWREAKIADPHVHMGLVAGDGGIIAWSHAIGVNRAKRYLLTGDSIKAEHAYTLGLVTDLVDSPEQVLDVANDIANKIVQLPKGGVEGTKKAFNKLTQQYNGETFLMGLNYEMEAMTSPDVLDVIDKFTKK